jgi:hypothetical protein
MISACQVLASTAERPDGKLVGWALLFGVLHRLHRKVSARCVCVMVAGFD